MTFESENKRFGIIAIESGFIIKDQLLEAMRAQVEMEIEDEGHKLIGEILIAIGYMEPAQVEEVIEKMEMLY